MKRPLKWKLFNIANILLFIFMSISLLGLLVNLIDQIKQMGSKQFLTFIAVMIGVFLMLGNYTLNFYILRKYFPSRPFTTGVKIINLVLLIFNTLFWFLLLFMFYTGLKEELSSDYKTTEGIILLWVLAFILLIKGFVLILQFSFQSVISKNYRESMLDLIDSLGDEKNQDTHTH